MWPTEAHIRATEGKITITSLRVWKDVHLRSVQVTLSSGEESPIFQISDCGSQFDELKIEEDTLKKIRLWTDGAVR